MNVIKKKNTKKWIKICTFILLSALLQAFALNCFYTSGGLLSGGFTGVGLMISKFTNGHFPLSIFLLVINIPLAILGYFNIGKLFTILSFINIVLSSFFLNIFPTDVLVHDVLLNAICGGVFFGLGISLALEAGACTGGTDFIALYISVKKQVSAGTYMLILNGIVILISAYFFGVDIAIYTLIATFISSQVVDRIHVRYERVTMAIITDKGPLISQALINNGVHGVTIMPAKGAYTNDDKSFIYTVISTYEVAGNKEIIFDIDPHAFVNITSSQKLFGNFIANKYE
ncbi:MAG: YitT family protein [Bacilli bacterium]|jgi:uncharacterized membrane-anchored protein YitT (DUF2179 family)|nr:YitT family protein [Bacilli bacterium]